jgi:hypothetical protein
MKLLGNSHTLGIAVGVQSLQLAELRGSTLSRTALFEFGGQDSFKDPAALGRKLAAFLKSNGFAARQAVVGFPAQWLMFKEKVLPGATEDATAGMLSIQAERDFSLEPSALALDFLASPAAGGGQNILLAAATRERIEQIQQLARAAEIKLLSITSSSLAISQAAGEPKILYVGDGGIESIVAKPPAVPIIRYIAPASSVGGNGKDSTLPGAIRRVISMGGNELAAAELLLCDDSGIDDSLVDELIAEKFIASKMGGLFPRIAAGGDADKAHATAGIALALRASQSNAGIDFLHSRLAPKLPSKMTSTRIWGAVAMAAACLVLGYLVYDWRQSVREVAELAQKRDDMKDNIQSAKHLISRINSTRDWYERRPNYLECLRTLTLSFPEESRVWATHLSMREDMKGILTGRAADEKSVLDLLDKLKTSPLLSDIKMLQMRSSGGKNPEISFSVSFAFIGGAQ